MSLEFAELPLQIARGCHFALALQPSTVTRGYQAVAAVANAAPLRLTVTAHGLPNGWTAKPIGTGSSPLLRLGEQIVTVVDADTLEINAVHALDWPAYEGGVQLVYLEPLDLSGYSARFEVRRALTDAEPVLTLQSPTAIAVDEGELRVEITSAQTQALDGASYTYRLTVRAGGSDQDELLAHGAISMLRWGATA